jgi:hypothetical protein
LASRGVPLQLASRSIRIGPGHRGSGAPPPPAAAAGQQQQPRAISPLFKLACRLAGRGQHLQFAVRHRPFGPGHRRGRRSAASPPAAAAPPAQRGHRAIRSYWVGPSNRPGFGTSRTSRQAVSFGDRIWRQQGPFFLFFLLIYII